MTLASGRGFLFAHYFKISLGSPGTTLTTHTASNEVLKIQQHKRKYMKKILTAGWAGLMVLSLASCQKDPIDNLRADESRIYVTNHDSTVNFSAYRTFSIADSAGVIEDGKGTGKERSAFDAAVIDAFKAAMQQRGFQLVARETNPDLGINVSRVYSTSTGVVSYPSYWDYYGGFYDPFYWGFGGFGYFDPIYYGPRYYDYYQVTQGSLSIDILDLKNAAITKTIKPVWSALARGTGIFSSGNAESQVASFFNQSPYLRSTN